MRTTAATLCHHRVTRAPTQSCSNCLACAANRGQASAAREETGWTECATLRWGGWRPTSSAKNPPPPPPPADSSPPPPPPPPLIPMREPPPPFPVAWGGGGRIRCSWVLPTSLTVVPRRGGPLAECRRLWRRRWGPGRDRPDRTVPRTAPGQRLELDAGAASMVRQARSPAGATPAAAAAGDGRPEPSAIVDCWASMQPCQTLRPTLYAGGYLQVNAYRRGNDGAAASSHAGPALPSPAARRACQPLLAPVQAGPPHWVTLVVTQRAAWHLHSAMPTASAGCRQLVVGAQHRAARQIALPLRPADDRDAAVAHVEQASHADHALTQPRLRRCHRVAGAQARAQQLLAGLGRGHRHHRAAVSRRGQGRLRGRWQARGGRRHTCEPQPANQAWRLGPACHQPPTPPTPSARRLPAARRCRAR